MVSIIFFPHHIQLKIMTPSCVGTGPIPVEVERLESPAMFVNIELQ